MVHRPKIDGASMHKRILYDIERRMVSGEWPPGYRIPYEHELTVEYGCSRMTVNKVMSALSSRGLVVRRRRAGTFVAAPQMEQSVLEIRDFAKEAVQIGLSYRYELLDRWVGKMERSATSTSRATLFEGTNVLRLSGLHHFDTIPIALEMRAINLDAVPQAHDESFAEVAPGTWLLEQVPWTEAEHVIRAIPADAKTARLLQTTKGAACLVLERYTWLGGVPITEVQLVHPGERYHFFGKFQPMSTVTHRTSLPRGKKASNRILSALD